MANGKQRGVGSNRRELFRWLSCGFFVVCGCVTNTLHVMWYNCTQHEPV